MCKTIKQRVKFKADPATVYDLLADSRKHTAFHRQAGGHQQGDRRDVLHR